MKSITPALCIMVMLCAPAVAQQPIPPSPPKAVQSVSENLVVTLTMTDKEQKTTELSLVVSSADFKTDFPDSQANVTSFVGTLTPEDENTVSIRYALGGQIAVPVSRGSVQYKSIATQATVRLKLGEPVQILKSETCTYILGISRLSEQQASGKLSVQAQSLALPSRSGVDGTSRFIFYSVLEGLYEDGLSNADVDQILLKKDQQSYFHFIYSCPVCNATIWALQAYRNRSENLYSLKMGGSTFGSGLSEALHEQLYSENARRRLGAINTLMMTWMDRRIASMNLSKEDRADLIEALGKKRKQGMEALESFRQYGHGPNFGVAEAAPAYVDLDECAVCNGAVGKPMKLPDTSSK